MKFKDGKQEIKCSARATGRYVSIICELLFEFASAKRMRNSIMFSVLLPAELCF